MYFAATYGGAEQVNPGVQYVRYVELTNWTHSFSRTAAFTEQDLRHRLDIADLLPHRHAGIVEEGQVLGRRVTPVERGDRHFLFSADADLGVIVKTGEEIDIEGRIGGRADLTDDGPNLFRRCKPHADSSDPAASADP